MSVYNDPNNPLSWKFFGDPAFVWGDLGSELMYSTDYLNGNSPSNPNPLSKENSLYEDLYNRVAFVKRLADNSGNRGYSKHVVVNASKTLLASEFGYITVITDAVGNPQATAVEITLPTRSSLVAAGCGYLNSVATSPYMNPQQAGIVPFVINGYQTSGGVPLKILVSNPTSPGSPSPGDDMAQNIYIEGMYLKEIFLYSGEYAEFIPVIVKDDTNTLWFLTWNVTIHNSGYGHVGKNEQVPIGVLLPFQKKANAQSLERAKFPRLWAELSSGGSLDSVLVAQGSKVDAKYGDGNGTTTFTLPDLSALSSSLVDWVVRY